ncbi:hypothetical protein PTTG_04652 [Puccinia triticina 1-1 BBBD Race 1]|uniref:Uncharacterized protein n=1 Tax=Puccinia triticina (isolate 1-1 / race 1 (BBBD)) TaxID=630390 RepID=A0A180GC34_PUCT1|nr:hypothetical protein PTTG_04652 [Puccinia triticina 1-1 BBBD Race 1]
MGESEEGGFVDLRGLGGSAETDTEAGGPQFWLSSVRLQARQRSRGPRGMRRRGLLSPRRTWMASQTEGRQQSASMVGRGRGRGDPEEGQEGLLAGLGEMGGGGGEMVAGRGVQVSLPECQVGCAPEAVRRLAGRAGDGDGLGGGGVAGRRELEEWLGGQGQGGGAVAHGWQVATTGLKAEQCQLRQATNRGTDALKFNPAGDDNGMMELQNSALLLSDNKTHQGM